MSAEPSESGTPRTPDHIEEGVARVIFEAAIREQRCAELLEALWNGGSATVDLYSRKLRIVTAEQLGAMDTE